MASVVFENVSKVFGDGTRAVDELDLEIADGEFMVLVGPSGCGKTTALRMVAGVEDISDGVVRIGERVVNGLSPKDRDIAMVFQSYALYPHLTVRGNVAFPLKIKKMPKAEIRRTRRRSRSHPRSRAVPEPEAARALRRPAAARRDGPGDRPAAGRLPDGRAAVEPGREAAGADARGHQEDPARPRVTTIYVTHDQIEAMTMGDRVAVMRKAELQQVAAAAGAVRPPGQHVRRRLHRQPCDEHARSADRAGDDPRARRRGRGIALDDETLSQCTRRSHLRRSRVVLGIRPEDLEDAALADGDRPRLAAVSSCARRSAPRCSRTSPSTPARR